MQRGLQTVNVCGGSGRTDSRNGTKRQLGISSRSPQPPKIGSRECLNTLLARCAQESAVDRVPVSQLSSLHQIVDRYCNENPTLTYPIRPIDVREMKEVGDVLAEAFHRPNGVKLLDGMAFGMFKGEVVDAMVAKLRYNSDQQYACLVATSDDGIIGSVEVSRQAEKEVLLQLPKYDPTYAYITGMAVRKDCRRTGIGSELLAAAEYVAWAWDEREIMLHVYQDNSPAIEFYLRNGYKEVARDSNGWKPFGGRPRLLMRREW